MRRTIAALLTVTVLCALGAAVLGTVALPSAVGRAGQATLASVSHRNWQAVGVHLYLMADRMQAADGSLMTSSSRGSSWLVDLRSGSECTGAVTFPVLQLGATAFSWNFTCHRP